MTVKVAQSALRASLRRSHAPASSLRRQSPAVLFETPSRSTGARQISVAASTSALANSFKATRGFSSTSKALQAEVQDAPFEFDSVERAADECDVCIVGAGPAGLSAAIRIKQLSEKSGKEIRVVVLEKGGEPGAHILSGAVIEPRSLEELFPNWKELGAPLNQEATSDSMKWLTPTSAWPMPHPPQMANKGNYIVSLSKVTRWLAEQAEALGVEIYSGFAGAKVLWTEDGKGVRGVVTNDTGIGKDGQPTDAFEPGMEFHAKTTLFAEGAHGSLSKKVIDQLGLREGKDVQTYGLGVKEVWRIKPENHRAGHVQHTLGWPLDNATYGGTWLYHMEDNLVSLGIVIGLDYPNPYISPFRELQRLKHHPLFSSVLEGGECVAYGARSLNEGGFQSVPKLTFPGGALLGCSAGFLNVPKIKGTHLAMKSGILAADTIVEQFEKASEESTEPLDMSGYQDAYEKSWIHKELKEVRNVRPSFHNPLGNFGGIMYSGIDTILFRGKAPWTFHHPQEDYAATRPASCVFLHDQQICVFVMLTQYRREFKPIDYPKPDGVLSFDILTQVALTGTNHEENQPPHLHIEDSQKPSHVEKNVGKYAGLLGRGCPAQVYEYVDDPENGDALGKRFVRNAQNCIHCKFCSIKTPTQDIEWRVPCGGGGEGPKYEMT